MSKYDDMNLGRNEAILNITWSGQNGELGDPVPYDASARQLRRWASEALQGGGVSGIRRTRYVDLSGFVVDRFPASRHIPYNRIFLRPKTPFG